MNKITISLKNGVSISVEVEAKHIVVLDALGKLEYEFVEPADDAGKLKYFFSIGEAEREKISKWLAKNNPATVAQAEFFELVRLGLEKVDYEFKISTLEPSLDRRGRICYSPGQDVAVGLSWAEWRRRADDFYCTDEWQSAIASVYELMLFKAYRIAEGYWSLEYVCDDSSAEGNYWDSPNASHFREKSGAKTVGGFADGVGNTHQIVTAGAGKVAYVGSCYYFRGTDYPVASVSYETEVDEKSYDARGTAVISVRKTPPVSTL